MIDPRRAVIRLTEEDLAVRLGLRAGVVVHTMRHRYDVDLYELLVTSDELDEVAPGDEGPIVDADLLRPAPLAERHVMRLGDVLNALAGDDGKLIGGTLANALGVDVEELDTYVLVRA